jgi:hypothetical protein
MLPLSRAAQECAAPGDMPGFARTDPLRGVLELRDGSDRSCADAIAVAATPWNAPAVLLRCKTFSAR